MDPVIDTRFTVWVMVDCTHPRRQELATLLKNRHSEFWPNNFLSAVLSDDGTRCLIKVEGGNIDAWKNSAIVQDIVASGIVLAWRTRADHIEVYNFIQGNVNWRRQWDDEANWPPEPPLRVNIQAFIDQLNGVV